jgi:hypothetical protein
MTLRPMAKGDLRLRRLAASLDECRAGIFLRLVLVHMEN